MCKVKEEIGAGLLSVEDARNYVLGGNSLFTLKNSRTGSRFTFKVKHKKKANDVDLFFVKVKRDNEGGYLYIGCVWGDKPYAFRKGKKVSWEAGSVKYATWIFKKLYEMDRNGKLKNSEDVDLMSAEVWHEGVCGVCGRQLTVPESIRNGIGPVCMKKDKNWRVNFV